MKKIKYKVSQLLIAIGLIISTILGPYINAQAIESSAEDDPTLTAADWTYSSDNPWYSSKVHGSDTITWYRQISKRNVYYK